MSRDVSVHWTDRRPEPTDLDLDMRAYADGLGSVSWDAAATMVITISLPSREHEEGTSRTERWIEVFCFLERADIVTRQQDEITNAIAVGLAERIARKFGGEVRRG